MFGQTMSPDLPNQVYPEPVRIGEQERLARRAARSGGRPRAWSGGRLGRSRLSGPSRDHPARLPEARGTGRFRTDTYEKGAHHDGPAQRS
jgi:hypothetical protein